MVSKSFELGFKKDVSCQGILWLTFFLQTFYEQTNAAGNALEKIASAYQVLYSGQLDEETILHNCMNSIRYIEKVEKEIGGGISSGIPLILFGKPFFLNADFFFLKLFCYVIE